MSIQISIDGRSVEVEEGCTVLDAARRLKIDIPTLCHLEKCGPLTSCLACVVKWKANGTDKIVPSCATPVQPGMVIESETADVREARRTALELLLSDHVGDCMSPCHRLCPLDLNVPDLLRDVQFNELQRAAGKIRSTLPLPGIITRLCHAPCENGCRRGAADQPVAIRDIERFVADMCADPSQNFEWFPSRGKSVVVVGAGPTGLAAAFYLRRHGYSCTVVDRNQIAGGSLKTHPQTVPGNILKAEIKQLEELGIVFRYGLELATNLTIEGLQRGFDAVLLSPGEQSANELERLGLETSGNGLKIASDTYQTNIENVFAAGSVVKPIKQLVKAMGEGMAVANRIHQFLSEGTIRKPGKTFSSIMGRIDKEEVSTFVDQASPAPRIAANDPGAGYSLEEAAAEAGRCVHCDCRAAGDCRLQYYSALYDADPGRFRDQRRRFEQQLQHTNVIYEPGKCIRCGICVRLTEQHREPLGLTYIGRGFDVRIATPLNGSIADGLKEAAAECIEHCPTGALVRRNH